MDKPVVDVQLEADERVLQLEPEPEQIPENPLPEAANTQNKETVSLHSTPDPLPGSAAELKDEPNTINLQDGTPDR